jgi:hypothetical protein
MGNCIQREKLTNVEGIGIVPKCQNNKYQISEIPKTFEEDIEGDYIWIILHTSNNMFQIKQEQEDFIVTTEYSKNHMWLRKERIIIFN